MRLRAAEFGLDPGRIGIWGFSAGGHLASTAATHFDAGDPGVGLAPQDPVLSTWPDRLAAWLRIRGLLTK